MTGFMRELREAMEDEARKQGRRKVQISAVVMGSEEENLYNALDLRAWVSEGLIDTLAPYTSKPRPRQHVPVVDGSTGTWRTGSP